MSNQVLDAALYWLDKGVVPIPLREKSKRPCFHWGCWQRDIPEENLVKMWFKKSYSNIGLVCGGQSHLTVIDFDALSSYYDWKSKMGDRKDEWRSVAESGYRVRSARGMHVYVTTDEAEMSAKLPSLHVDIKSVGGYVVAPPSVHPNGIHYTEQRGDILRVHSVYDIFEKPQILFPQHLISQNITELDLAKDDGNDYYKLIKAVKENLTVLDFSKMLTTMFPTSECARWWMGRCINPNHEDKNPSYRVDTRNNRATCLSSSCVLSCKSHDVIDLYAILYNTTARDATYTLAKILRLTA